MDMLEGKNLIYSIYWYKEVNGIARINTFGFNDLEGRDIYFILRTDEVEYLESIKIDTTEYKFFDSVESAEAYFLAVLGKYCEVCEQYYHKGMITFIDENIPHEICSEECLEQTLDEEGLYIPKIHEKIIYRDNLIEELGY